MFDGMGHSAVQTYVAVGFLAVVATIRIARCRWFKEDLGSEVVFWFVVAHAHDYSPLPFPLRKY